MAPPTGSPTSRPRLRQTLGLTFRPVVAIETDLYLEEPAASEALAAAEVVAAMRGHPGEAVANRPEVGMWAQEHFGWLQSDLVWDALAAVNRIRSSSELRDLGLSPRSARVGWPCWMTCGGASKPKSAAVGGAFPSRFAHLSGEGRRIGCAQVLDAGRIYRPTR